METVIDTDAGGRGITLISQVRDSLVTYRRIQRVRIVRNADRCNSHGRYVCPSVTFRCFV